MTRRRFHSATVEHNTAWLRGAAAAHAVTVLRAKVGQEYEVACQGRVFLGRITSISSTDVCFTLGEELPTLIVDGCLTLAAAIFKFDRFEWLVEKATELGVTCIQPLVTRRTDRHLAQAAPKRVERWQRVAHQASEQSRRHSVPAIEPPLMLNDYLEAMVAGPHSLWLVEGGAGQALLPVLTEVEFTRALCLAVGPEGGWAAEELTAGERAGFRPVTLGPKILRAETAAIAALAVVQAWRVSGEARASTTGAV